MTASTGYLGIIKTSFFSEIVGIHTGHNVQTNLSKGICMYFQKVSVCTSKGLQSLMCFSTQLSQPMGDNVEGLLMSWESRVGTVGKTT